MRQLLPAHRYRLVLWRPQSPRAVHLQRKAVSRLCRRRDPLVACRSAAYQQQFLRPPTDLSARRSLRQALVFRLLLVSRQPALSVRLSV